MTKYEQVKRFYDTGAWGEIRVRHCVEKGIISEQEYKAITGHEYLIG